jgi:rhamnogalacturonyl hydrolase YesR
MRVPDVSFGLWMASSFLSKNQVIRHTYVPAVTLEGYQKVAATNNNATLLAFASDAVSSLVSANGTVKGWNSTFYTLDDVRMGNNILHFWNSEGRKDKKYELAAHAYRQQLNRWPRSPEGGFWHRAPTYANQMWLDGIYMADQFYATYTSYFEPENVTAWNDIALQFDLIEEHARNHTTNLIYHGFDELKKAVWANPETGASPFVWDRAVGWYFVALVEVMQVYPKTLPGYARMEKYLTTLAEGVKNVQTESGGWYLLMDPELAGKEGNYIESSATALFTYAYLKGVRTGLLDPQYKDTAFKAYELMTNEFIIYEKNGTLSWNGTVEVGSLKGDASYEVRSLLTFFFNPCHDTNNSAVLHWCPTFAQRRQGRRSLHVRRIGVRSRYGEERLDELELDALLSHPSPALIELARDRI